MAVLKNNFHASNVNLTNLFFGISARKFLTFVICFIMVPDSSGLQRLLCGTSFSFTERISYPLP